MYYLILMFRGGDLGLFAAHNAKLSEFERYRHIKRLEKLLDDYQFAQIFANLRQYREELIKAFGSAKHEALLKEIYSLMDEADKLIVGRDPSRWDYILEDQTGNLISMAERKKLHDKLVALDA